MRYGAKFDQKTNQLTLWCDGFEIVAPQVPDEGEAVMFEVEAKSPSANALNIEWFKCLVGPSAAMGRGDRRTLIMFDEFFEEDAMQTYAYEVLVPEVSHVEDGKKIIDRPAAVVAEKSGLLENPGDSAAAKLDIAQKHYAEIMEAGTDEAPVKLSEVVVNVRNFLGA